MLTGETSAKKLASDRGTLAFFRGRYSLHRVPPVVGSTPRMNSVLTYSVEPGHMLSEMAQRMYYGLNRVTFTALTPRLTPHLRPSQAALTGGP